MAAVPERHHHSSNRTRRCERIADDARPHAHPPIGDDEERIREQRLHELRGPLAAVKILAESLAGGALKEKKRAKDFLRRINSEIDRMAAMVNELMELSRLESEQSSLQLAPLDLHPLIADLRAEHDELKKKRKVALDVAVPDSLPPVRGDEEKLRQVFENLLSNAVKFTPADGRILSLPSRRMAKSACA